MGFLNDYGQDWEKVEADPFAIPDGKYPGWVFKSKVDKPQNGKNKGEPCWILTFKVDKAWDIVPGREIIEFFRLSDVPGDGEKTGNNKSRVKARALSLGIPENRITEFQPSEVEGLAIWFTVLNNNGFRNVRTVELRDTSKNNPQAQTISAQQVGTVPSGINQL